MTEVQGQERLTYSIPEKSESRSGSSLRKSAHILVRITMARDPDFGEQAQVSEQGHSILFR